MNENHYALLIGINEYIPPYEGLGNLDSPHEDVNALEAWLTAPHYGGIPSGNYISLKSTPAYQPDYNAIQDALSSIYSKVKEKGGAAERIYFYFSGHGLGTEDQEENTALCLGSWKQSIPNRAISSSKYKSHLITFQYFKEIVFLTDCCRDLTWKAFPLDTGLYLKKRKIEQKPRYFEAFGCNYTEESYGLNQGNQNQSVFTKILIDGLKGAASDPDTNTLTDTSLKNYLRFVVPAFAAELGLSQIPDINGNFDEDAPIVFLQKVPNFSASRNVIISTPTKGPVTLHNRKATRIQTFMPDFTNIYTITLPAGAYVLKDESTQRTKLVLHTADTTEDIIF